MSSQVFNETGLVESLHLEQASNMFPPLPTTRLHGERDEVFRPHDTDKYPLIVLDRPRLTHAFLDELVVGGEELHGHPMNQDVLSVRLESPLLQPYLYQADQPVNVPDPRAIRRLFASLNGHAQDGINQMESHLESIIDTDRSDEGAYAGGWHITCG